MKKIICLLLAAVVLLLSAGCNNQSEPTEPPQAEQTAPQTNNVRPTYKPNVHYSNSASPSYEHIVEDGGAYYTLEERLEQSNTTDIVKATYLGAAKVKPQCYYFFQIDELVRGEIIDTTIAIPIESISYSIVSDSVLDSSPITGYKTFTNYSVGSKYLLLLNRISTPHLSEEDMVYLSVPYLVIGLDKEGRPMLSSSFLYNEALASHVKSEALKKEITDGKLIDCILELTKDDAYKESSVNITDKNLVIENAEYVLNVEIISRNEYDSYSDLYSMYKCKVISTDKGTIEWQPATESGYVYIALTDSKVKIGEKYTIACKKQAGDYYLTSRNAIFPYTE